MLKNIFIVLTEKMRRMERKVGNTFSLFTVRIYFYFLEKAKKPSLVFSGGHKMGTFIINGVRTCHGITNQSFSELCGEFINFMNTYCISKKPSNFFHQFTLISLMFWLLIIQFVKLVFKGRDPTLNSKMKQSILRSLMNQILQKIETTTMRLRNQEPLQLHVSFPI